jgi:SAM-dependent methyltransferase
LHIVLNRTRSMGEIERIIKAYQEYDASIVVRNRRDPLNPGNIRIAKERSRSVTALLSARGLLPLTGKRILDVGCGSGVNLASLASLGAEPLKSFGIDLLPDRIEAARSAWPGIDFRCGNAERMDFANAYFDLVLVFTVFSSILSDDMGYRVAKEVRRVLRSGGAVLWYDFRYNNPRNPHVRGVTRRHIRALFEDFRMELRPVTLFPPLARRLGSTTAVLYPVLATLPPLRTHYLGLLVKP